MDNELREKIEDTIKDYVWGLICPECKGGGADGQEGCLNCNGRGIYNWNIDSATEKLLTLIHQDRLSREQELREAEIKLRDLLRCPFPQKFPVHLPENEQRYSAQYIYSILCSILTPSKDQQV